MSTLSKLRPLGRRVEGLTPRPDCIRVSTLIMTEDTKLKDYEISYLAKSEGGEEEVRQAIKREAGEILLDNPAQRIVLAYPIKKEKSAYFGYVHFCMDSERMAALDHDLRTKADILRFLLITPPFAKTRLRSALRPRTAETVEKKPAPAPPTPLSNEDLEKKIEEILK